MKKLIFVCLIVALGGLLSAQTDPEWLWASRAGGTLDDYGYSIAVDNTGNTYVSGHFQNTADFGGTTLTTAGNYDIFVAKMDPSGNWLWAKRAGSNLGDYSYSITADDAGNCYLTGGFQGTASFGQFSLVSGGIYDAFVAKLDTNGNWLWATRAGGSGSDDVVWNIAVDANQNCYVAGTFMAVASFGSIQLTSKGGYDAFVAKLDPAGYWVWAKGAGGTAGDQAYGIGLDNAGNIYVTGYFAGTADFFMNILTSQGSDDIFVAKLDPDGNWQWAISAGGPGQDGGYWLAADGAGNSYITGAFVYTAQFGGSILTSWGGIDLHVSKVDTNGNWLWTRQGGGPADDHGFGICLDPAGGVYLSGNSAGNAVYGGTSLSGLGAWDIVAAKLDNSGNWDWALLTGSSSNDTALEVAACSGGYVYLTGVFSLSTPFGATTLTSVGLRDIFVAKLSQGVGVDDELAPEPTEASCLYEAWPNPFHTGSAATIKARIAAGESGTIILCNLRGQVIQSQQLSSGTHQITVEGGELPAGIYLYRLKTPSVCATRKLVLLN